MAQTNPSSDPFNTLQQTDPYPVQSYSSEIHQQDSNNLNPYMQQMQTSLETLNLGSTTPSSPLISSGSSQQQQQQPQQQMQQQPQQIQQQPQFQQQIQQQPQQDQHQLMLISINQLMTSHFDTIMSMFSQLSTRLNTMEEKMDVLLKIEKESARKLDEKPTVFQPQPVPQQQQQMVPPPSSMPPNQPPQVAPQYGQYQQQNYYTRPQIPPTQGYQPQGYQPPPQGYPPQQPQQPQQPGSYPPQMYSPQVQGQRPPVGYPPQSYPQQQGYPPARR